VIAHSFFCFSCSVYLFWLASYHAGEQQSKHLAPLRNAIVSHVFAHRARMMECQRRFEQGMRQSLGRTASELPRCHPLREDPLELVAPHLEMALKERTCSYRCAALLVDRRRPEGADVTQISPDEHHRVTWHAYK